jgi:hypothetical protein
MWPTVISPPSSISVSMFFMPDCLVRVPAN